MRWVYLIKPLFDKSKFLFGDRNQSYPCAMFRFVAWVSESTSHRYIQYGWRATYPSGMDSSDLKRKTIIVTHKVFIIAFNMSMKYQLSYFMDLTFSYCALTGFSTRAFVGFLCCRFACLHRIIRAASEFTMHERSKQVICVLLQ